MTDNTRSARRSLIPSFPRTAWRFGVAVWLVFACVAVTDVSAAAQTPSSKPSTHSVPLASAQQLGQSAVQSACGAAQPGVARCFARYLATPPGSTANAPADAGAASPRAVSPADLRRAYGLPLHGGAGAVVGIVDAYDNPTAESDLATFRARYGLAPCTTASGCLRTVNQRGKTTPLPSIDYGWQLESALDLDAVSATCADCRILLVEADSASTPDLGAAVDTAVRLGATVVSNSYGLDENSRVISASSHYDHPGVPILVATGDNGYEAAANFPADAATTIAVGGTTLTPSSAARGFAESAWSGAGSGCSAYIAKPTWQHDKHCLYRTIADVAADADPYSGILVEDTGRGGMLRVGGTSLATPLAAGILARAVVAAGVSGPSLNDASFLYQPAMASELHDVTSGSNGFCGGDYLCSGRTGYDGPTGVGTFSGVPRL